ncbi:DoxX family protein [Marixanthomonas spongiae]|uniref:DoxX family protein n=1 Tax=Marixanthomonas spongiae TaxID=2174845 RepID=A0A2U0I113_9FLAO|nr:DoxX family protein [Marixanthomonas spongiae]PVW14795.1 DoxX family protein [Marixanthomonas spongiae]
MKQTLKRILDTGNYPKNLNIVLLILRFLVGILMLTHGMGKLQTLFGGDPIQFHDPLGVGAAMSLALAVFAEVLCSILLIIGLGTRLAAIPLLFTMMVAAFVIHINDDFGRQELPMLYAAIYIVIATIGAGRYSLDYLLLKNNKK